VYAYYIETKEPPQISAEVLIMEINQTQILAGTMTEQEISETYAKLATIGQDGSLPRKVMFELMKLAEAIRQATIPNQEFFYETANLEQFCYQYRAVRLNHNLTPNKVQDGINWLKEQGMLEDSFVIPDLELLKVKARCKVLDRRDRLEKSKRDSENGKNDKKHGKKTDWNDLGATNKHYSD
jgi:hypothetical protein